MSDELIQETRRIRHDISRRCGHDPRKVVAYYRNFQEELKRSGKYRFHDDSTDADRAMENAGAEVFAMYDREEDESGAGNAE